jgi:hypothetical protein
VFVKKSFNPFWDGKERFEVGGAKKADLALALA